MARSKLEIIIEAQNQASRDIERLSDQLKNLSREQGEFSDRSREAGSSFREFTSQIALGNIAANLATDAIRGIGRGFTGFIKKSIDTSLSVERIAATLPILAKNTGRTTEEIDRIVLAIREENKSLLEATEVTRGIILAGLDEADALRLITVARDVGATVGRTSADVNRLILESFQTLTPGILKQVGINISLREVYKDVAKQLGKNVTELNTTERQTGLLNAIMNEGAKFGGAYEAAMGTVQKQVGSVKDASVDLNQVFGDLITGGFFPIVNEALKTIRAFRAWAFTSENELNPQLQRIADTITNITLTAFELLKTSIKFLISVYREFKKFLEDTGFLKGLKEAFELVSDFIRDDLAPVWQFFIDNADILKIALVVIFGIIGAFVVGVAVAFIAVIAAITVVIIGVVAAIGFAREALTAFFAAIIVFNNNAQEAFEQFRENFENILQSIK
ncbi:hypothetical protein LCGC14_1354460, partial [marine sediment metagenome]